MRSGFRNWTRNVAEVAAARCCLPTICARYRTERLYVESYNPVDAVSLRTGHAAIVPLRRENRMIDHAEIREASLLVVEYFKELDGED